MPQGRSSWRSRFDKGTAPTPISAAPAAPAKRETLRVPLELILDIVNLARASCVDRKERDKLYTALRGVNCTFRALFPPKTFFAAALDSGEELPSLLKLVRDKPALAQALEGVHVRNFEPEESKQAIERFLPKLRKACPQLEYVRVGRSRHAEAYRRDGPSAVLHSSVLLKMQGLSALHLHHVNLFAKHRLDSTLRWPLQSPNFYFPNTLRHLILDHVSLEGATTTFMGLAVPATFAPLFPPTTAPCALTTLYLADCQSGESDEYRELVPELLRHGAATLQALHYSSTFTWRSSDPPRYLVTLDGDYGLHSFPALRILSLSLAHLRPTLFATAPNLEYLTLTLCDSPTASDWLMDYRRAMTILEEGFAPSTSIAVDGTAAPDAAPVFPRLRLFEMVVPKNLPPGYTGDAWSIAQMQRRDDLLALLRARGVETWLVVHDAVETKHRWIERVREVLGEKV